MKPEMIDDAGHRQRQPLGDLFCELNKKIVEIIVIYLFFPSGHCRCEL